MSKNSKGLFTLVAGIAAGAAAMFFSKAENRTKTIKVAKKARAKAKKAVQTTPKKAPLKKTTPRKKK